VIGTLPDSEAGSLVRKLLERICRGAGRPVVFFFDEADCIPASSVVSFLRQLRDGYVNRDEVPFPVSIAQVGITFEQEAADFADCTDCGKVHQSVKSA